ASRARPAPHRDERVARATRVSPRRDRGIAAPRRGSTSRRGYARRGQAVSGGRAMERARGWISFVVLCALALAPAGGARAQDAPAAPVPDEPAFLAALNTARTLLAGGRANEGLKLVAETLETHRGKDYVRAKRPDLEDLVKRLSFRAECPPPDPQTVVKGTLK